MKKKLYLKRILSLIAAMTIALAAMGATVSAANVSDAKNSIVAVVNNDGVTYGTGFAIGQVGKPVEYIVTNNHVVNGELGNTTATVYFSLASDKKMLANIYYYNEDKDIAVLRLPETTTERQAMILCPMEYVDPDDAFAALGYPGNQATDWPKYNTDDITITKGGIKKADRIDGQDVYMLDIAVTNGNSGGPLVNSDGEVVGINTFSLIDDSYALAIDELLRVIDTDRIPVTIHSNNNIIFFILGGILLLAIIALVIVLITRKKGGDADYVPSNQPTGYTPPSAAPNQTTPKGGGVTINNPKAAAARIIAVGGALNGKKYSVSGSTKIGRDASKCGIAFPVNTQGVSGVHCELSFDGSVCYVKDLNSSYGTFTVDGRKLNPNAAQILRSGDKFYLASPDNMFEVRF